MPPNGEAEFRVEDVQMLDPADPQFLISNFVKDQVDDSVYYQIPNTSGLNFFEVKFNRDPTLPIVNSILKWSKTTLPTGSNSSYTLAMGTHALIYIYKHNGTESWLQILSVKETGDEVLRPHFTYNILTGQVAGDIILMPVNIYKADGSVDLERFIFTFTDNGTHFLKVARLSTPIENLPDPDTINENTWGGTVSFGP